MEEDKREPQPTPNAQSPPPRCTSPPEGHPREAGARGGEGAPGVAPTACRGDPGPALEVGARQPGRGGAPGLEAPAEPLSGPRWAHPGPRGRAGPPQPAPVEGDECGQPPRARAATHRPRAARRPPPGATAPPGRGVTAVSAARCASPRQGLRPARALFCSFKNDCDFFQELYWQKDLEPADRCGPATEGRARETRLPSAADAPHSEHAPDFQCARARRRPRPAAPPPSWLRLRGAAFPVRQLGLVGFQEAAGEDAAEEGPQTLRLPSGQLSESSQDVPALDAHLILMTGGHPSGGVSKTGAKSKMHSGSYTGILLSNEKSDLQLQATTWMNCRNVKLSLKTLKGRGKKQSMLPKPGSRISGNKISPAIAAFEVAAQGGPHRPFLMPQNMTCCKVKKTPEPGSHGARPA
ncbi:collagen alpha-1(I) chain-like [Mesoplodon densirostris]|uniref:collagen alpha-1(I) chain-like n=1 Tax=Mesoplodon densirostris TaxID=48708 RepID=UPI0028DD01CD|nr:collagen alpha-1(I) chain-like [Mesoplodon densirostris]